MLNEHEEALERFFTELPDDEFDNLAWHKEQGTTLLCGKESYNFTDGKGGG